MDYYLIGFCFIKLSLSVQGSEHASDVRVLEVAEKIFGRVQDVVIKNYCIH
jgi:hypothetical protein